MVDPDPIYQHRGISLVPLKDPYSLVIRHQPVTDPRLSLADLGLYVRCLWLFDVCSDIGDVAWFIREFDLPEREARESICRLIEAGYLRVAYPELVEARNLDQQAASIQAALEQHGEPLAEEERATIARFAELLRGRARKFADAADLFTINDLNETETKR
jgi:hypothetical protein